MGFDRLDKANQANQDVSEAEQSRATPGDRDLPPGRRALTDQPRTEPSAEARALSPDSQRKSIAAAGDAPLPGRLQRRLKSALRTDFAAGPVSGAGRERS